MSPVVSPGSRRALNVACFAAAAAILLSPGACALYRNDKCYLDEKEYKIAYSFFIESGSLDLVKRQLVGLEWERCKVNEAVYRLTKISEIPEEETAKPVAPPPQAPPRPGVE